MKKITTGAQNWRRNTTNPEDIPTPAEYQDLTSTELAPDEIRPTLALTESQRLRAEQDKAGLLEALHVPAPATPQPEAQPRGIATGTPAVRVPPVKPTPAPVAPGPSVDDALEAQVAALQRFEAARVELAKANEGVDQARDRAATAQADAARAEARQQLAPLVARVTAHRDALLHLHRTYGGPAANGMLRSQGPLGDYAKSVAAGDLVRRTKLQSLYNAAAPLSQRIARAYKACTDALKSCENVLTRTGFDAAHAAKECETALAFDVETLRLDCANLVSAVNAWRQPGQSIRIRLDDPAQPWRPDTTGGNSGVETYKR